MLKIGLVDDHKLVRKSLRVLIDSFDGVGVALEAENGLELLENLKFTEIDVLLLDLQMPVLNGYETCKRVRSLYPDIKVLIISHLNTKEALLKIVEIGAHGYFSKNSDSYSLEKAIHAVNESDFYFDEELNSLAEEAGILKRRPRCYEPEPLVNFSEREIDVIRLACKQFSSNQIADKLCITARTVESHRRRIMERTNSKNFIGVILFAFKQGLIGVEDLI
ncbi:response regulator transcription factor [Flavobacterium sp.]|uniref:response regulator transcription factor n=1 Tax=Flavobacterium sp. TaxID=239 RepID=UPI0026230AA4|nr:response regulator transcription factor [Flavobacterium sp.]